ncbi:hypothetical protein NCS52_00323100 [Fusarium sp. LHS14.1]|nr:hypothetical protein NCS52_00323100 [Fusarium sp. LHS14.1]
MNSSSTTKNEPVTKAESGIKRDLALERSLHVKTEGKRSLDGDGVIIFVGARSLSSVSAPGRCSCEGLCNHDAATTSAPAPAPAPTMARERKPVVDASVSISRTLEVISLISDSEGDDDFPSPPTRKGKERARTQPRFPPTFPLIQ